jgi:hypothetical protein
LLFSASFQKTGNFSKASTLKMLFTQGGLNINVWFREMNGPVRTVLLKVQPIYWHQPKYHIGYCKNEKLGVQDLAQW